MLSRLSSISRDGLGMNQIPTSLGVQLGSLPAPSDQACRQLSEHARHLCGISIDPRKKDFLSLRLSKRVRALDLTDFDAYARHLAGPAGAGEARHLVEALATHTTSFFRERHHYDWLESTGFAQLAGAGAGVDRPLTIWSAACSTGAELWSAGMIASEAVRTGKSIRRFELLGTDVSRRVLRVARGATYHAEDVTGVAPGLSARYLMRSRPDAAHGHGRLCRIVPELRERAQFVFANLTQSGAIPDIAADVIFLRNVLIYFDAETQQRAVSGILCRMRPGAFLLTGHAEKVPPQHALTQISPSIYRKE